MPMHLQVQKNSVQALSKSCVAMRDISFISRESVEMFEELVEISDDELSTMDQFVQEAGNLCQLKR
ncbi:Methyl-accepting chemotaxis protein McpA OS=Lysinibacillus sphaericus OX=1421 GN=mcpA_6 PE=3 SV=1 [Lysinibacillus sphaericus]